MSGWWNSASREEKLAQIDGCIEVGMTTAQCAMNLRFYDPASGRGTIGNFARRHGREFPNISGMRRVNSGLITTIEGRVVTRKQARDADRRQAYLSGEPVDFWSAR